MIFISKFLLLETISNAILFLILYFSRLYFFYIPLVWPGVYFCSNIEIVSSWFLDLENLLVETGSNPNQGLMPLQFFFKFVNLNLKTIARLRIGAVHKLLYNSHEFMLF